MGKLIVIALDSMKSYANYFSRICRSSAEIQTFLFDQQRFASFDEAVQVQGGVVILSTLGN